MSKNWKNPKGFSRDKLLLWHMCIKNSVACINLTFGSLKEIYLYCGSKAEVWTINGFYPILYIVKVAKYQNQFSFPSHLYEIINKKICKQFICSFLVGGREMKTVFSDLATFICIFYFDFWNENLYLVGITEK